MVYYLVQLMFWPLPFPLLNPSLLSPPLLLVDKVL